LIARTGQVLNHPPDNGNLVRKRFEHFLEKENEIDVAGKRSDPPRLGDKRICYQRPGFKLE